MSKGTRKKRILIFSVPFGGHLNILKELIRRLAERMDFMLVITGWFNLRPMIADLPIPVVLLGRSPLRETDPALWTLPRSAELLDDCLKIARTFKPDAILYDFFSLEGPFTAVRLDLPCVVSIPAMIGPNNRGEYLRSKLSAAENIRAIETLRDRFALSVDLERFELISDGIHLPAPLSLVWSYRSVVVPDWNENRAASRYAFVGNIRGRSAERRTGCIPSIYLSLGTVVLGNLWNQQPETRRRLAAFFEELAEASASSTYRVIFASQGRKILGKYPGNWEVLEQADQLACLAEADLFITHGGSNSFHEALVQRVPMVVLPFFGDQPLVARCAERLGIGINMGQNRDISTLSPKDFLDRDLAGAVVAAADKVIKEPGYRSSFDRIDLTAEPLDELMLGDWVC